ncbi:hypothetical protein ASZ90_003564 [hydrocarbon metagenome]|uniref:Glycosyltransferase 2-like domain-containing protein n=1 Tax=hydrocarbon metagenome TaxID=938273 RepID=A0A0W8G0X1_9ZZZZ
MLVVDDGSTDETKEILSRNNIDFLTTGRNSGGPNKGRNIGLKTATGDYICIMDHDDRWKSHKIITQLKYVDKAPIITSGYTLINNYTNTQTDYVRKPNDSNKYVMFGKDVTFKKKLMKSSDRQNAYLGGILFSSELKNNFFEEVFGMVDYDWVLRLFNKNHSLEICESLYFKYIDDINLSYNESYRIKDFYYSLMAIEVYADEYPREVRRAYKKIHGTRARYYYIKGEMKKARFYFLKAELHWKTILYYLTTFIGSKYVIRKFKVSGSW